MTELVETLKRQVMRERAAREQAETLLEDKSRELYEASRALEKLYKVREAEFQEQRRMADELRQSEAKLRESQSRLSSIMNSIADAVIAIGSDGTIQTYNRAAERIFGYSVTETIGRNISMLLPEPHRSGHDGYLRRYCETLDAKVMGINREVEGQRKDGSLVPLEIAITEMDVAGAQKFVGICRDITRRKQREAEKAELEQELRQAQKMESLGTLAGGIAHEINTPVQYVGDNVRFLQDAFADLNAALLAFRGLASAAKEAGLLAEPLGKADAAAEDADLEYLSEEIPTSITQTLEGVGRISEIVQAIKEFSHPDAKEKSAIDINHAISTTVTVTRNQWKYVADLEESLDGSLPPVPCLPGEFNQVILNLIVNAAHAIEDSLGKDGEEKGHITVTTEKIDPWVEIRVSDSGTGIAQENLRKIFDPFFTTKEPGKGTGQGLAISHSIVTKKHGGSIAVESELGQGTTFVVRLPLGDGNQAEAAA